MPDKGSESSCACGWGFALDGGQVWAPSGAQGATPSRNRRCSITPGRGVRGRAGLRSARCSCPVTERVWDPVLFTCRQVCGGEVETQRMTNFLASPLEWEQPCGSRGGQGELRGGGAGPAGRRQTEPSWTGPWLRN